MVRAAATPVAGEVVPLPPMPTYDYVCQSCGHRFEVFQSMSAERLTHCPRQDCAGRVRRLIGTGAGIVFKGSGFYETDYKRKASQPGAGDSAASPSPASGSSSPSAASSGSGAAAN